MCIFCPNSDGAFKPTTTSRWSHLLCAIWIPEVSLANATFMEPVQDVEKVPKQRWKLVSRLKLFDISDIYRLVTSASKKWVHAFSAAIRTASSHSTSPVHDAVNYH
jgi:hypothetical protein